MLSGADWLPTLCSIVGVKFNAADFDGEDTSAAWLGQGPHVRSKPLLWKTSSSGSESFVREPVLLIKCAWGGKSLAVDFRPPSAGKVPYSLGEKMDAARR